MARHIELNPSPHLTIGVVGAPGERVFYLQGGRGEQTISLVIEKEQAAALAINFDALLREVEEKYPSPPASQPKEDTVMRDMRLREPLQALFRVGNMGLGYNEDTDQVVLVAYELVDEEAGEEPNVVSYWVTREQVRLLIAHTENIVRKGRFFDPGVQFVPKRNGHVG
ncbi:MAG TPA: DUF3090 family protein [Anaerolineae bacterium]|nr:DUF3090 family protein [Anaerolineae bacterium]